MEDKKDEAIKALWDALSEILEDTGPSTYVSPELRAKGLSAIELVRAL